MKLNIDQPVIDFSGKPIENDKKEIITFRSIIETTLNAQSEQYPLTSEKKLHAFQIGIKLFHKKLAEYDLTVDQVTFIKDRIGLFYGPVIYGRFLELIGDESVSPAKEY
jgi:hypothetical protein